MGMNFCHSGEREKATMSSRVLIPLDGFQGSEDVMDEAAGMAGEVEAVHLVWVDTSLPLSRARRGRRLEAAFYEGFQDSGADEYLAAFRRRLGERGIEVTTAVLTGDPVSLIVAAAKESGADLILIGENSWLARWVNLGQAAENLMWDAEVRMVGAWRSQVCAPERIGTSLKEFTYPVIQPAQPQPAFAAAGQVEIGPCAAAGSCQFSHFQGV